MQIFEKHGKELWLCDDMGDLLLFQSHNHQFQSQVREVFEDMYAIGLQPSVITYNTLLNSYAQLGHWADALDTLDHMQGSSHVSFYAFAHHLCH